MADDDREVRARLEALDAEVKAEADVARARKNAALAKLREKQAEQAELRARQTALVTSKHRRPAPDDDADGLRGALELANRANRVKKELARRPAKGEKSWIVSGLASAALGPLGWLYAGSLREAIPAATVWILLATLASKILPTLLLWPVLMVVLPLSGLAGVVYAIQYNRHGGRQRLFDREEKDKREQLESGREE